MTVFGPQAIREIQIPLVAVMLLGGGVTKFIRVRRVSALDSAFGPTALFPLNLRRPVALATCVVECGFGIGLIVTAAASRVTGGLGMAEVFRFGAGLLFLIATSALVELRMVRPDVGCGCFGDFSTAPVSGRTIARSAFLAAAILSAFDVRALKIPHTGRAGLELLAIVCAELLLIGFLSPEVGEGLIRLGYSEPCELRAIPSERTLATLRRSKQWRRHSNLITSDLPTDIWRELCWRYVVYPSAYAGRPAELVFAVYLQRRRPMVYTALVDFATGVPLPLPDAASARGRTVSAGHPGLPVPESTAAAVAEADLPMSTHL